MRSSVSISVTDFRNLNLFGLVRRFVRRTPLAEIPPGEAAPVIVLKDLDGQRVSLAVALEKGPVLAAFFKVNCTTSQLTFPFLQRIYEMYGGSNFTLWGISQNHPKDTKLFIRKFGIKFPILIDGKGYPVSNRYGLELSDFVPDPAWRSHPHQLRRIFEGRPRSDFGGSGSRYRETAFTALQTGRCGATMEARLSRPQLGSVRTFQTTLPP